MLGDLTVKEIPMRIAVCMDSLSNLHRALRTRHAMYLDLRRSGGHVTQSHQTRLKTSRSSLASAVKRHADRYRRSYAALLALDPHGDFEGGAWKRILRPLLASDLTAPREDENELGTISEEEEGIVPIPRQRKGKGRAGKASEGRRELSWIWTVGRSSSSDQPFTADGDGADKKEIYKCKCSPLNHHHLNISLTII